MERQSFKFEDDGRFPNNQEHEVVIYRGLKMNSPEEVIDALEARGWTQAWINGIYDFAHYHSTAHEVLVCTRGEAKVRVGAENGETFEIQTGCALLLPAGTAHQRLSSSSDFQVVGAYPQGQSFDMMYGKVEERPQADKRIRELPPPTPDPLA